MRSLSGTNAHIRLSRLRETAAGAAAPHLSGVG